MRWRRQAILPFGGISRFMKPDQVKARELVRQHAKLGLAEHCEPVKVLSAHEFAGMRPGEVKRHG